MTQTLGIDLGTSGVRAVVVNGQSAEARATVADRRDPHALWAAVRNALATLDLSSVRALAVAGTSGSMLPVDANGAPLAAIRLYNDGASAQARLRALAATTGVAHVLHEADWIAGQFGVGFATTDANNALKSGYDAEAGRWSDAVADLGPVLPRVVPPGTPLGAACYPGLANAIVAAGTTDGCASFLAAGAERPGDAVTALGSTLTLKLFAERPVTDPASGVYSHHLLGLWLAGGASNSGGAVLARFFTPDRIEALSASIDPTRDSGLELYPLLAPGERFPVADPGWQPRIIRPPDDVRFLHALLEGIARIEARGYARLAELGAARVTRVLTLGGGAANPAWTVMRARILGVPVTHAVGASAAHGAALLARTALGQD